MAIKTHTKTNVFDSPIIISYHCRHHKEQQGAAAEWAVDFKLHFDISI